MNSVRQRLGWNRSRGPFRNVPPRRSGSVGVAYRSTTNVSAERTSAARSAELYAATPRASDGATDCTCASAWWTHEHNLSRRRCAMPSEPWIHLDHVHCVGRAHLVHDHRQLLLQNRRLRGRLRGARLAVHHRAPQGQSIHQLRPAFERSAAREHVSRQHARADPDVRRGAEVDSEGRERAKMLQPAGEWEICSPARFGERVLGHEVQRGEQTDQLQRTNRH
jgi:hypothetical protein